jgi:hypothetical protein
VVEIQSLSGYMLVDEYTKVVWCEILNGHIYHHTIIPRNLKLSYGYQEEDCG